MRVSAFHLRQSVEDESNAFQLESTKREGKEVELSFLDRILLESQDYARQLGDRLKEQVFTAVFPHRAEGFIDYQRRVGKKSKFDPADLNQVYRGTLTLLYRLLFLLYAEARDLLPVKETRGYYEKSFKKTKQEIADMAGTIKDEADARLKK